MKITTASLSIAALLMSSAVLAEDMNNQTVLTLSKAGLGDSLVIDKINSSPCGYDVSSTTLITLKNSGLSESIISAMVRRCDQTHGEIIKTSSSDPKVRHLPGIYLMESWTNPPLLSVLRPSKPSGVRTKGNGSILFPLIAKQVIPGSRSRTPVQTTSPTFYFYFNTLNPNQSDFSLENSAAAQSPDEFTLVKFKQKGDARELDVGRASTYGGSLVSFKRGLDQRYAIKFTSAEQENGTYKVSPDTPLEPGEYAFVLTSDNGLSRIYDFSVVGDGSKAGAPS